MPDVIEGRTAPEIAAERVRARTEMDGGTDYSLVEGRAVLATLDWLEGRALVTPITDQAEAAAEDGAVRRELRAAKRLEAVSPLAERVYPSGVIRALKWWLHDPTAGY
jgi:hypothetical protein